MANLTDIIKRGPNRYRKTVRCDSRYMWLKNLGARFKLWTFSFHDETSETITKAFEEFLNQKWGTFSIKEYEVYICLKDGGILEFWNANKYYAWAHRGKYSHGGIKFGWSDQRPSTYMLLKMKERIEEESTKQLKGKKNGKPGSSY